MLTIQAYDQAEATARLTSSYPAIRAFSTGYFAINGVPTHAKREDELHRYVDMMGELHAFDGWDRALFDDQEIATIETLRQTVRDLTAKLFGCSIDPVSTLLSPWPILRIVRHLSKKLNRKLEIFEAAAGCGTLGAYLILDGHRYNGFDVTQGLYLWQNRLLSHIAGSMHYNFVDLVNPCTDIDRAAHVRHTPWWRFAEYHRTDLLETYDIVICDSAFGEMDMFGYHYIVAAARRMIEDKNRGFGCLLFTSVGDPKNRSEADVLRHLKSLGFKIGRFGGVYVAAIDARQHHLLADLPQPRGKKLSDFFKVDDLPDNYAFCRFAGLC